MRVLLDENLDWKLRHSFDPEHTAVTVAYQGWAGRRNGELLAAAQAEFDALLTVDSNLDSQQHVASFDIAVVVVRARSNRRDDVAPAMPEVNRLLPAVRPGRVYVVAAER